MQGLLRARNARTRARLDMMTLQWDLEIADRDEVIGRVIDNLNLVLATVNQRDEELSTLVVSLQELVSGLSMPVGLKATADRSAADNLPAARAAADVAARARHFLGVTSHGLAGIVHSCAG